MENTREIRVVTINTTAWGEENLQLITNLSATEIINTVQPIVLDERNGGAQYNNEILFEALATKYPWAIITLGTAEIIGI
tara:strand:- start:6525 stop:6764 length:240 start_codon:yes stop_codon:yes gene_type:complete